MEKLRLGLVGLNFGKYWAKRDVLEGEGKKYVEITTVCARHEDKAKECAEYLNCKYVTSIEVLLSDPEIDAVVLLTPPAGRAKLVRQCILAGKPVLTTKPFEEDAQAALDVLKLARERNAIVHMNSPSPVPSDDLSKIFEWRDRYDLGKPIAARWENYARYHETADGSWYDSPELCPFSPVLRIGIYGIADLIQIFGEVESVQGTQSRLFTGRPTPDNAEISMKFKNGGIASVFASFCIGDGLPYPAACTLHFERGTIRRMFTGIGRAERTADFQTVDLELNCLYHNEFHMEKFQCDAERRSGAYLWKEFYDAVRSSHALAHEINPEVVAGAVKVVEQLKQLQSTISFSGKSEK